MPLLVSDKARFVWALGGTKSHWKGSVYDSVTDTWDNDTVPRCKDGDRFHGASLYLNGYIYVYGGQSLHDSPYYDTIERWNTKDPTAVWHYINVKEAKLGAIKNPLMTVLNETEIVIMYEGDWDDYKDEDDDDDDDKNMTFVLNFKTDECKIVAQEVPSLDFYNCQSAQIGPNRIVALVSLGNPTLIGWKKGDQKITTIKQFGKR